MKFKIQNTPQEKDKQLIQYGFHVTERKAKFGPSIQMSDKTLLQEF